jgi:hypothetical protein
LKQLINYAEFRFDQSRGLGAVGTQSLG